MRLSGYASPTGRVTSSLVLSLLLQLSSDFLRVASAVSDATLKEGQLSAAGAGGHGRRKLVGDLSTAKPAQMYMVPLREEKLYDEFKAIKSDLASDSAIVSLISISMSVNGTVIWYDEWEDGYENDVTSPTQNTTKIWGDNNYANGCVEQIRARMSTTPNFSYTCTKNDTDIIEGGETLILENTVPVSTRNIRSDPPFYDGGDVVKTSFPTALTRAGYPTDTGSLLAGAVELLEAKSYGTEFVSPVGHPGVSAPANDLQNAFQHASILVMAVEDGTQVYLNGILQPVTLNMGEEAAFDVGTNDKITTTRTVQANLMTGDPGSTFEMRWYSLIPTADWYHDYYTPVHTKESEDKAVALLFNPGPDPITVEQWERDNTSGEPYVKTSHTIPPGENVKSSTLGRNDGTRFTTNNPAQVFYALTLIDYDNVDSETNGGSGHDWGHPLIPADKLTSQVLVGLGYGCTANNCGTKNPRSTVWVTAASDVDLYVSFDGSGTPHADYNGIPLDELESITIADPNDKDMTGAYIWATQRNQALVADDVYLAVAWGQQSDITPPNEEIYNLDMGTVVPPLPETNALKSVAHAPDKGDGDGDGDRDDDGKFSPGDILEYTIRVTNTGRVDLPVPVVEIVDEELPLYEQTAYVAGSTKYTYEEEDGTSVTVNIPDDSSGTAFPLDGSGISNNATVYVGSAHQVTFEVEIMDVATLTADRVVNIGHLNHNGELVDSFTVETPLVFSPSIKIQTTVFGDPGHASGTAGCPGVETYGNVQNTEITYCYEITNTGNTFLDTLQLSDDIESSIDFSDGPLAPGETITVVSSDLLTATRDNVGNITANPTFSDGSDIPNQSDVYYSDGANVVLSLTTRPTKNPTDLPSYVPTSAPTESGHPIDNIDLCKSVVTSFPQSMVLRQFSFLAHTIECVNAKVYVSDTPITDEEVTAGMLEGHWTLLCDGNVMGMGDDEHTFLDSADCTAYEADANTQKYFYITMETLDEATHCTNPDVITSEFDVVSNIPDANNDICPENP